MVGVVAPATETSAVYGGDTIYTDADADAGADDIYEACGVDCEAMTAPDDEFNVYETMGDSTYDLAMARQEDRTYDLAMARHPSLVEV